MTDDADIEDAEVVSFETSSALSPPAPGWLEDARARAELEKARILTAAGVAERDHALALAVIANPERARALLSLPLDVLREQLDGVDRAQVRLPWQTFARTCEACGVVDDDDLVVVCGAKICTRCRIEWRNRPSHHPSLKGALARAKRMGLPATLTDEEWAQTIEHFEDRCAYCQGPWSVIEHATPMPLGGGTTRDNCLPSCAPCNGQKAGKRLVDMPISATRQRALDWLNSKGNS